MGYMTIKEQEIRKRIVQWLNVYHDDYGDIDEMKLDMIDDLGITKSKAVRAIKRYRNE